MGKRWTKDDDEVLTTMHGEGVTAFLISLVLDRTAGSVSQRAYELGITTKRRVRLPIDLPDQMVVKSTHVRLYDFPAPLPLPAASEETPKPSMLERMFTKMLGR